MQLIFWVASTNKSVLHAREKNPSQKLGLNSSRDKYTLEDKI